jgi:hypothetical protein
MLQTIASAADAKVIPRGSQLVLISNTPNITPRMKFSEDTTGPGLIVDGSLVMTYALGNRTEEDGIEIEYRDSVSYQPAYVLYPGSSVRPREIRFIGCTDKAIAEARAKSLWLQEQYSRFVWQFNSELDALLLQPGDTIEITPLGKAPVLCVVSEVNHTGPMQSSVTAFEYDARAYA